MGRGVGEGSMAGVRRMRKGERREAAELRDKREGETSEGANAFVRLGVRFCSAGNRKQGKRKKK